MKHVNSYDRAAPTPEIGSEWIWERQTSAAERLTVVEVKWNGEEWWVKTAGSSGIWWNDLSRFWEAVSKVPKNWKPPRPLGLPTLGYERRWPR